jgi:hypothetical protein
MGQTAAVEQPVFEVTTVGPAGWRARLGPTNVGSLLASATGERLWQPLLESVRTLLADNETVDDDLLAKWRDYHGQVWIAVWPDLLYGTTPTVAVVLHGDGKSDLAALAKDAARVLGIDLQASMRLCGPVQGEDRVGFYLTSAAEVDAALVTYQSFADRPRAPLPPQGPALAASLDLAPLVVASLGTDRPNEQRSVHALGLPSLQRLGMAIRAAGPHVHVSADLQLAAQPLGVFAGMFPTATKLPNLFHLLPPEARLWRATHFDLATVATAVIEAIAAYGEKPTTEVRASLRDSLGFDLEQELLAHLGTEVLFATVPEADATDDDEWAPDRINWTLSWRLRDAAAFTAGWQKLLESAKPFVTYAATIDVDGATAHRCNTSTLYAIWWSTANGMLTLAGGHDAELLITEQLTRQKQPPPADPTPSAALTTLSRHFPAGTYGLGSSDIRWLGLAPAGLRSVFLRELLQRPNPNQPFLDPELDRDTLLDLLQVHHLDRTHLAVGRLADTFSYHLYW